MGLIEQMLEGDQKALSRLMSIVENNPEDGRKVIERIYSKTGNAHIVGITGSPGVGKSTLVDTIIDGYRSRGKTVGVVAVDPSSPFTGGAVLGDRIRMQSRVFDGGVFIRSLSSQGELGGVSRSANDIIKLLDAFGKDVILIETVGTGQSEVEILKLAHTVIVVLAPGLGDDIQAMKAGILEIGDLFVVNKCDLPGAEKTAQEIRQMLEFGRNPGNWMPQVFQTSARSKQGIDALIEGIAQHRAYMLREQAFERKNRERIESEIEKLIFERFYKELFLPVREKDFYAESVRRVANKEITPAAAVDEILKKVMGGQGVCVFTGKER